MELIELIPFDHYVSRAELRVKTGRSDRDIRDEINRLRKDPRTVIISSSSQSGYKRPSSLDEFDMCLNESRSRVKDELEKQNVLIRAKREWEKQGRQEQLCFDF